MLNRYSEVFRSLLMVADLLVVGVAWLAAYWLRFHAGFPAPLGVPDFEGYGQALVAIVPIWFLLLRSYDLYEPRRTSGLLLEFSAIVRATAAGVVALVALSFFYRSYYYSRGVVVLFSFLSAVGVFGLHATLRLGLRALRRRGHNLRTVVVVGAGVLAEQVIERIFAHPEAGLRILGVLADHPVPGGRGLKGIPVIGGYGSLKQVLRDRPISQVIVALPREDSLMLEKVLSELDDEITSVKVVPDLSQFLTLRSSVEDLDGLPVINLRESPMLGWSAVSKRAFDLAVSGVGLLLASPLLAAIALAIWVTSGRPILYAQQRMGLDGRVFRMFKFRTMQTDAEGPTGPVWAQRDDPRRTRLGAALRHFSLDELPQLWNVLRGDMSLVGPRPERPFFIERFRQEIPRYMLRHKVKAGLTGWAQVHGWRGDTSIKQRVDHDIYYIQNWSLGFDVRILLMSVWRGITHRNAY